jgi:predicted GIY-YIG superfamily endonuclease
MKHKVYKITNLINGKFYIGVTKGTLNTRLLQHSKSNSYLGRSIRRYGIEHFKIEEIHSFDNELDSYNKEAEIVNEEFLKRNDVYNLTLGGHGGFIYLNKNRLNLYGKNGENGKKNLLTGNKLKDLLIKRNKYNDWCKNISHSLKGNTNWLGKHHTKETKIKIGKKNSIHQKGKGNSQYGTYWVYCPYTHQNKKIKCDELSLWEDKGWVKGRKIK